MKQTTKLEIAMKLNKIVMAVPESIFNNIQQCCEEIMDLIDAEPTEEEEECESCKL